MTLAEIERLGKELAKLGWGRHLKPLRELYAATRDGCRAAWSLEHAAQLASYLGLGPNPLEIREETGCPACVVPNVEPWKGTRTVVHLPDRWVSCCTRCGAQWVTLERRVVVDRDDRSLQ